MMDLRLLREIGTIGLVSGILLVVVNLLHPVGNTEMYGDGVKFMAKMDTFWVILHLVIAITLLPVPMVIRGWVATLSTEHARVWGDFALTLFVMGTVIGSIHLAGIDGGLRKRAAGSRRGPGAECCGRSAAEGAPHHVHGVGRSFLDGWPSRNVHRYIP